ncbi:MAG: response regulator [Gammaproteobacteria bacterium]|nr:response regulator [Gammaproteobacteria bacterium]
MNKTVLIVEDELHIIESLRFILQRAGYLVHEVHDGNDAVNSVRAHIPDVIVLDLMLPNKNGFEILKELKSDLALSNTPVLMLTAKGQQQDRANAEQLKVDAFITKPFSNQEVLSCIDHLSKR